MVRTARNLMALVVAGSLAVVFAAPSPALAKADYGVVVSGGDVSVGATVVVTVTMGNDGGIDDGAKMCLFQIVGAQAPRPYAIGDLTAYRIAPGSRLVKVAGCQRPARDAEWAGSPDYFSGTTRYRLRASSGGWLAFEAVLQENGTRVDVGVPIVSNVVRVGGSGGARRGAAEASLVSIDPAREPTAGPVAVRTPAAHGSPGPPATGHASSGAPAAVRAAHADRPKLRRVAGVVVAVVLLGGLVVGFAMVLRPRAGGPGRPRRGRTSRP